MAHKQASWDQNQKAYGFPISTKEDRAAMLESMGRTKAAEKLRELAEGGDEDAVLGLQELEESLDPEAEAKAKSAKQNK